MIKNNSNYKRAFIIALKSELPDNFLKEWKQCKTNYIEFYQSNNKDIIIFSGVGKANAANATSFLINALSVKNIINVGTCGSLSNKSNVNDIYLVNKAKYIDVDLIEFGYKYGQLPHEEEFFIPNHAALRTKTLNEISKKYKIQNGVLGTSDSFINKVNLNKFTYSNSIDVNDMEGVAIVQVCNKYKINCTLIKVISDNINKNTSWTQGVNSNRLIIGDLINLIINNEK